MIINITGISGCGKSYLIDKVKMQKGFIIKDADDFWYDAMKKSIDEEKKFTQNYENAQLRVSVRAFIEKNKNKHIFFVGFKKLRAADYTLFMKVPKSELPKVYRRRMKRELDKIISSQKLIEREINKRRIENLDVGVMVVSHGGFLKETYKKFKHHHRDLLDYHENDDKSTVMTQCQIIKEMKSIMNVMNS